MDCLGFYREAKVLVSLLGRWDLSHPKGSWEDEFFESHWMRYFGFPGGNQIYPNQIIHDYMPLSPSRIAVLECACMFDFFLFFFFPGLHDWFLLEAKFKLLFSGQKWLSKGHVYFQTSGYVFLGGCQEFFDHRYVQTSSWELLGSLTHRTSGLLTTQ